jgi:hypothetical protein
VVREPPVQRRREHGQGSRPDDGLSERHGHIGTDRDPE